MSAFCNLRVKARAAGLSASVRGGGERTLVMPAVFRGAVSWLTSVSMGPRPSEEAEGIGAPQTEMVEMKKPPEGFVTLKFL